MSSTVERGKRKVRRLCKKYGIKIIWKINRTGHAWNEDGQQIISIPRIRGLVTLATAFHEIGHCHLKHTTKKTNKRAMQQEVEAWQYARKCFQDLGIEWVPSVGAHAIACLAYSSIQKENTDEGHGEIADIISAVKTLRKNSLI